jgi:hypothetical protein
MCSGRFIGLILVILLSGWHGLTTSASADSPDVIVAPDYEQFLVIPLRIHVLRAPDVPEIHCALSDADLVRILGKMNPIWHKAGIHWGLESIVREPAEQLDRYRLSRGLNGVAPLNSFRLILPEASRRYDGVHVYYIHHFSVNGVYMGDDYALVQETARLRAVEGGIDEPIPRVTAHELGHALALQHRQDQVNLLASGTTGTLLNQAEVDIAREKARSTKGALTVAELRNAAEKAESSNDLEQARRLWSWLSEIPGSAATDAQRHLAELQSRSP